MMSARPGASTPRSRLPHQPPYVFRQSWPAATAWPTVDAARSLRPETQPEPQAPMVRPPARLRPSAPSRQLASPSRQTWRHQAPQTARSVDPRCLQRSEPIEQQSTSVLPTVQHRQLVDSTKLRSVAKKVIGLSALFGVINAPLLMTNPPAAVVAAPSTNLAAVALLSSMRDNQRRSSSYLQTFIALRCPLCLELDNTVK